MAPFVKLILPAGCGILFSYFTGIGWGYAASCMAVSWAASWVFIFRGGGTGPVTVYPWLTVFFFFSAIGSLMAPRSEGLPHGDYVHAEILITGEPVAAGRWRSSEAVVTAFRTTGGTWNEKPFTIRASIDTLYRVSSGDRLMVKGYINGFGSEGGPFASLMSRRGVAGRIYVTEGSCLASVRSSAPWTARLHNAAVRKMAALKGDPEKISVAAAMVSGDKRAVPPRIRRSYRDGGGAHLLAVSGLHVGIVFVLVNLLLWLVPAIPGGHIVKNLLAIGAVWLFAAAAGLSPSVGRAALMFTFVQLALVRGTGRDAVNVIAASAFVMLALNPNYAFDPSFVLSYAAVLAIVLFFPPVYSLFSTRSRIINAVVSVYIVGIAASVAVAPFVSYWFGSVPVAGIFVNPVVILTAHVIVLAGVLWLVWPFGFGEGVFGWAAEAAVTVQNQVMGWCAASEWATIEGRLPLWAAVVIYCAVICLSVPLKKFAGRVKRKNDEMVA